MVAVVLAVLRDQPPLRNGDSLSRPQLREYLLFTSPGFFSAYFLRSSGRNRSEQRMSDSLTGLAAQALFIYSTGILWFPLPPVLSVMKGLSLDF